MTGRGSRMVCCPRSSSGSRGDTSRSRAAGSTGLGLAIVAAVVDAHRGTCEVTGRPGYTEFSVRLPVLAPAPTPAGNR
jgi:two-component system OmpR family sensor kinase